MPDADGYSFIRAIRKDPQTESLAVGALTAHARPSDVRRALLEGFDVHLAKPISPDALVVAVAELHRRAASR
jgi:CheY-like chemotaxis protein